MNVMKHVVPDRLRFGDKQTTPYPGDMADYSGKLA
jgi:hypothetical protein